MTTCVNCTYYQSYENMGQCRRFPQAVTKSGADWCGEHTVKVYDIASDTTITRGKNVKTAERSNSSKAKHPKAE